MSQTKGAPYPRSTWGLVGLRVWITLTGILSLAIAIFLIAYGSTTGHTEAANGSLMGFGSLAFVAVLALFFKAISDLKKG